MDKTYNVSETYSKQTLEIHLMLKKYKIILYPKKINDSVKFTQAF